MATLDRALLNRLGLELVGGDLDEIHPRLLAAVERSHPRDGLLPGEPELALDAVEDFVADRKVRNGV